MMTRSLFLGSVALACMAAAGTAGAATHSTYTDRTAFEATLALSVTDDYSSPAYFSGDVFDSATLDIFSGTGISAVLGETDYTSTGFPNNNFITRQTTNPRYCAGCNGSFTLSFGTTSVGDTSGVFGVGFDFLNADSFPYSAFVTFGDTTTANFDLPAASFGNEAFFGITSEHSIFSIAFGGPNGATSTTGGFEVDNLTIGSQELSAIPLSGGLPLALSALGALALLRRRSSRT